jgi:hypothetical protein
VAADYLPGGEFTASRRQSGRAGLNAASGRNVGQVCANGAATKLHHWFSWAALTKCRCSEIALGDPNTRYGKPLTRLTGPKKTREMAHNTGFLGMARPGSAGLGSPFGGENEGATASESPFVTFGQAFG